MNLNLKAQKENTFDAIVTSGGWAAKELTEKGLRTLMLERGRDVKHVQENLLDNQIKIIRNPTVEEYGKVLVFADLYGNQWDLIETLKKMERHDECIRR